MDHGMEPFITESHTEEHRTGRESLKRKRVDDFDEFETGNMDAAFDMMSTCATDATEEYYVPPAVKKRLLSNEMPTDVCEPTPEMSNMFKIPENKDAPRMIVMPQTSAPTIMLPTPGVVFPSSAVSPRPVQIVQPVVDHYPPLPVMYALPVYYTQTPRVALSQAIIDREIERKKWKDFLAWENKYNYYGALYTKRGEQS